MTSEAAADSDLYSASVEDLATVACFLTVQEMRFGPRKVQNPEMDFRRFRAQKSVRPAQDGPVGPVQQGPVRVYARRTRGSGMGGNGSAVSRGV
ncbi:hypothetical protein KFK09_005430 [Dendrobium nobile]|uniref:Uncharacterized protein n=1 Tax=Dendrobium nobile TaxID=94219 RepID=A0A8T3BVM7_DENNO|nr:hypothetical protein KFK09_005430 [Dendrobium nobile]